MDADFISQSDFDNTSNNPKQSIAVTITSVKTLGAFPAQFTGQFSNVAEKAVSRNVEVWRRRERMRRGSERGRGGLGVGVVTTTKMRLC